MPKAAMTKRIKEVREIRKTIAGLLEERDAVQLWFVGERARLVEMLDDLEREYERRIGEIDTASGTPSGTI